MDLPCPSSLSLFTDNLAAYHFIRSHVESGSFTVSHIPGPLNSADLLTKPLSRIIFLSHVTRIGLVSR